MLIGNRGLLLAALVLAAWQVPASANGAVYKWVDAEGNTHYTATPPPDGDAEQTNIRNEPGRSQPNIDSRASADEVHQEEKSTRVNVAAQCSKARSNVNRGIDEWLESAEEGLRRGNTQERHDEGVARFRQFRTGINQQLAACPSKYDRDESYKKMVDCFANLRHPSNFFSCEPEK